MGPSPGDQPRRSQRRSKSGDTQHRDNAWLLKEFPNGEVDVVIGQCRKIRARRVKEISNPFPPSDELPPLGRRVSPPADRGEFMERMRAERDASANF
jgi:hypothetical protein